MTKLKILQRNSGTDAFGEINFLLRHKKSVSSLMESCLQMTIRDIHHHTKVYVGHTKWIQKRCSFAPVQKHTVCDAQSRRRKRKENVLQRNRSVCQLELSIRCYCLQSGHNRPVRNITRVLFIINTISSGEPVSKIDNTVK